MGDFESPARNYGLSVHSGSFDISNQQIQEGNFIPNMERNWDEIAYFQVGDNPRPERTRTGKIDFENVFKFIYEKGYEGSIGMEHGNFIKATAGEQAVIKAYPKIDNFIKQSCFQLMTPDNGQKTI